MKYAKALKVVAVASCILAGSVVVAQDAPRFPAHSGTVLETMNSGGYTYAQIDEDGTQAWIAVPQTHLAAGDKVTYQEQMRMPNFHSSTLDRTFDEIRFATIVSPGPATATAPTEQSQTPSAGAPAQPVADMAGSQTVEEIYARKDELKGKTVSVRGTVVKVLHNIMDKTWVHIQDGTGGVGSSDIIFTSTTDDAAVGDLVTAKGTLETDVDYGYGYAYPVIVQDSSFTK